MQSFVVWFTDIIIGAPYEEDGAGAIYIYLGSADGVDQQYSQVKQKNIPTTLGFRIFHFYRWNCATGNWSKAAIPDGLQNTKDLLACFKKTLINVNM